MSRNGRRRPSPYEDNTDFENCGRRLIDTLSPTVVTRAGGRVVYDSDAYAFHREESSDTAHTSL